MTARQFEQRLRVANDRFRFIPGPNASSGLYLKLPRHPDSNPANGLRFIAAIPSPRVLWNLSLKSSLTTDGVTHPSLRQIVRRICRKKIVGYGWAIKPSVAHGLFGGIIR